MEATTSMLTVNDGLSQGMIFDILQSRDGFIWIATKDGLNRYDGARFEVFSPDPFAPFAIGDSEVHGLFEDSRGWIWVMLPNGLDILDPVSCRFFHVSFEDNDLLNHWSAKMTETPDGAIWFADAGRVWKVNPPKEMLAQAAGQGKSKLELPYKTITLPPARGWPDGPLQVLTLLFTQKHQLLLGTNHGLFRLDPATEQILTELPMLDIEIRQIAESKSGEIWMNRMQHGQLLWVRIANEKVPSQSDDTSGLSFGGLAFDDAGYFWVNRNRIFQKWKPSALFNHGRPELEINPAVPQLENNPGFGYTKYIIDKSGIVWIGTSGFGVIKINENAAKFKTFFAGSAHRILFEDPGGGLYSAEIPDKKFLSPNFDRSVPNTDLPLVPAWGVKNIAFDPAGNIWSFSKDEGSLYRKDISTKNIKKFPVEGDGMIFNRQGKLVIVNEKGLRLFDPRTETSRFFSCEMLRERVSWSSQFLYEDSEGVLWIFGYLGLVKATPVQDGYRFEQYLNNPADSTSLLINTVMSVADDPLEPGRFLWVGTKGGGLNRLEKQFGRFKHYKTDQGLPDKVVYGILPELSPASSNGAGQTAYIWLSTNKGLCRFDVRAETAKNFTVADGLQGNEFNSASYLKTHDGTLIFGGVNGINAFHPDSLHFNAHIPQTRIVGLKVNNQDFDISGKSSITLSHEQNLLNFDFAALEFTNPAQNQYRYQLAGVDKNWVALGTKNSIQFANLAPGTYTFKVQGSNNDGVWSEQPAELEFTIRPPWYASWWAYLGYLLLIGAGIWQYYQYLLRRRFSEQETLRLQELDDFKSRFFTNITHEFRTPLTVMLGMSDQLAKEEKDEQKRNRIGLIKRSGENLLRLVNQILDLAKLESNALKMNYIQGDVLTFIKYISESLHSLANAQNLLLRVESDESKIVMDYDPERLLQIVHNLLSNAIKFTPSGGRVTLRAGLEDAWFHLSVSDTGAGIPPEELPHLFERFFQAKNQEHAKAGGTGVGLSLTRELVRAMGGEIRVESIVGVGSTFFVKLPVTNNCLFEEKSIQIQKTPEPMRALVQPENTTAPDRPDLLLIEDNPDVVEYLNACLKEHYNLEFAYNGQAGIEDGLENTPDLIVSDVMMPFKDGFEVLEALKNDERTSHIPIILLTARADVQSRLAGLRKGADAYLSKPFNQEELLAIVENLLETRRKLQLKYQQRVLTPEMPVGPDVVPEIEDVFLQKVRAIIDAHYSNEDFGLPQLCQKVGMSRSQLFRKMKALTDVAPSDLIRIHRLNKAKALLESGTVNVAEAAWETGFKDPSYFSKLYQEEFGEAPSATRK